MYIDSYDDLVYLLSKIKDKTSYIVPLPSNSSKHNKNANILALYISCDKKEYVVPYLHAESLYSNFSIETILAATSGYVYNKPLFLYEGFNVSEFCDIELAHYLGNKLPTTDLQLPTERFYSRLYSGFNKTNNLVSMTQFVEYAKTVVNSCTPTLQGLDFYSSIQTVLHAIEKNGLAVDNKLFTAHFGNPINLINNFIYTKYNLFTATGRPSNRFGGINFAALNKQDDTRRCFISRFEDGKLVEMDFKAYHPHIIASLCNYDFGEEDVYQHLAKYYFNTDNPTADDVNKAKEYTFNQVYGGIDRKYKHIPFFSKVADLIEELFANYVDSGYAKSRLSERHLKLDQEDLSKTRLFNYFIQMTETELNMLYLQKLFNCIDLTKALPVLYTYDSVVFDCKSEYIKELVSKIFQNTTQKYPIVVKTGDNYKEMDHYNI